jgi:acetyltransferase-like isoleucine patch superfamily enzyme
VHIGWDVFLDLSDEVRIEDDVHVGMRAVILTHFYLGGGSPGKPLAGYFPPREAPVVLRRGCAVGAGCIVLPGVTIGEDAIVGAGAVVKADVPPRSVVEPSAAQILYTIPGHALEEGAPRREPARPSPR